MPRDLSALPRLTTAEQVLEFMRQAPEDRLLSQDSNFSQDEWNAAGNGAVPRVDDLYYVVISMAAAGASDLGSMVRLSLERQHVCARHWPEELAIVDQNVAADLIKDAESGFSDRRLCWDTFAHFWVLPEHPEAETDLDIVKAWGYLPLRGKPLTVRTVGMA